MLYFLQQLLNGLHIGAVYALLAFGYALINGVLHRTNLAHGAIFGFAGQVMILAAVFGWQILWLTLPATLAFGIFMALLYGALVSAVLARSVFQPLANRSPNTIVAATLGVSLVLMEMSRIAADTRDFWLPPLLSQPVVFAAENGFRLTLTVLQLINCAVAALLMAAASRAMATSRFGREWRAISDDPLAAAFCGIDTKKVFRQAVVYGGLAASVAGILAALYYGNISFGSGLVFGLKILFVTAVGGYLSPARAAAGGLAFGIAESLWSGYFPIEWRDGWMLAFLVALLVLRPERSQPDRVGAPG
ncbi:branched-chain amino acid ABC transporter permease [Mesorhizobium sp. LHD-90]|uniref:branched-chain amino acid ABC transporter permease n=1 Tax=Mesorhizobium sp. LHD-90 TaxID=3071414 RepID=UPI0027DF85B6|nr:branched-chain amino acid ABC transporter permease [Mesorhizobium sp. LHD-90]MDQ6437292.1 branched-chain amino acid ABC transporter permease [Mesorhizobium sp. LHD-90]